MTEFIMSTIRMAVRSEGVAGTRFLAILLGGLLLNAGTSPVRAQQRGKYYHPLSQNSPVGRTAEWLNQLRRYDPSWLQPMQVEAPGGGRVDVFSGSNVAVGTSESPARLAASVGHVYRLRVSEMPAFPDVEIFPTIELIDRLHPPQGREHDFPIPVIITKRDIETAQQGQLVTRVIYLEQPQLAQIVDPLRREIPQRVVPTENAIQEADRLGRPMAILRIGGRTPTAASPASFFGTGGAVQLRQTPVESGQAATVSLRNLSGAGRDVRPSGIR